MATNALATGGFPSSQAQFGRRNAEPDPYSLPPEIAASRARAYDEELRRRLRLVGSTTATSQRALKNRMLQSGFGYGAGEYGKQAATLESARGAEEINAAREIEAQRSAEELGWAKTAQEQGFQKELLKQQQGGSMDIERLRADLAERLQKGEITSEEAQNELNRALTREQMAQQGGQFQQTYKLSEADQALKETLGLGNLTLAQQQQAIDKALAEGQLNEQTAARLQQNVQFEAGQAQQQGQFETTTGQQAFQFGQTLEWEKSKQDRIDALQREGWSFADAQRIATQEFQSAMAETQQGYTKDLNQQMADINTAFSTLQYNQSMQAKAMQSLNDYMAMVINQQVKKEGWGELRDWMQYLKDTYGIELPDTMGPEQAPPTPTAGGGTTGRPGQDYYWDGSKWVKQIPEGGA